MATTLVTYSPRIDPDTPDRGVRVTPSTLQVDPSVSLLLPCNVVVEVVDGRTHVAAIDPRDLMTDPRFAELAADAADRLQAAIGYVAAA